MCVEKLECNETQGSWLCFRQETWKISPLIRNSESLQFSVTVNSNNSGAWMLPGGLSRDTSPLHHALPSLRFQRPGGRAAVPMAWWSPGRLLALNGTATDSSPLPSRVPSVLSAYCSG